jgi:uncharacterized protein
MMKQKRRYRTAFLLLLALYLLGYVFVYFAHPLILFRNVPLAQTAHFLFPFSFREVNFQPEPGVTLNALFFPTKASSKRGVVLFFHGNADNLARWGKEYPARFLDRGYDVWMYDYRQFGKSEGHLDEESFYSDAEFIYRQVLKQYPESQIVLYGYSLGTGIATKVAAEHRPRLLLLEAPYYTIPDVWWQHAPLYPYDRLLCYHFRTDQRIRQVRCPVHIFHGTNDEIVPYEQSLKLAELLNRDPAELITTIPGGRHKNLAEFADYQQALGVWLSRLAE